METAGKSKYAARMASHLNEQIDAAAPITRAGGTARQIGGALGGAAGGLVAARDNKNDSDVQIGQFAWLGLGPTHVVVTKASMMGKPTGEPLVRVAYADVAAIDLTEGKITLRVDLDLRSGHHVAFEAKRHGQNASNVGVLNLLQERCRAAV